MLLNSIYIFDPTTPNVDVNGYIIDMPGDSSPYGNTREALGEVIVLNLGKINGLKPGDVLGIYVKYEWLRSQRLSQTT